MSATQWLGCAAVLVGALSVALAMPSKPDKSNGPSVSIALSPSSEKIYLGEKNTINTTIHFPNKLHESVRVTLYPALDIPNVVITKIVNVKLGNSIKITGSTKPIMDWGIKKFQVPGRALSCEFELGHVMDLGGARSAEDKSIEIQYEAMVPEDWEETFGPGNPHQIGASVESDNKNYVINLKNATFAYRSLPLLFRGNKTPEKFLKQQVHEMSMGNPKIARRQPKVVAA